MSKKNLNEISPLSNALLNFIFILGALSCIIPFFIVISVSLSDETLITQNGYGFLPRGFTLQAYSFLFQDPRQMIDSYLITIISTVLGTSLCLFNVALFAYPLSKKDFRFRSQFSFFLYFTMLFGGGLVPWYIICTNLLHMKDTIWALVIPPSFASGFVFFMRAFYESNIPPSLIESARIDGAGEWRTFLQIVFPLSLPGLSTVALFTALSIWNDFFNCMLLTTKPQLQTLNFLVYRILSNVSFIQSIQTKSTNSVVAELARSIPTETLRMSICIVAIGPIIFAYPFFQKYFIKGLTVGAVKG